MERIFFCGECRKFFYADCEPTVYLCTCTHCGSGLTISCDMDKLTYNRFDNDEKNFFKNKIKDAYPDLVSIAQEQDERRQRIGQMEERERARREELVRIFQIAVTTGDVKQDYAIIGPVCSQIHNRTIHPNEFNRKLQQYHRDISDILSKGLLSQMGNDYSWLYGSQTGEDCLLEIGSLIAMQELKKRGRSMGADAIICMRQNMNVDMGNPNNFSLQMYGTAIKYK